MGKRSRQTLDDRPASESSAASSNGQSGIRKIVIFCAELIGVGGEERLLFEEARYIQGLGIDLQIIVYRLKEEVFFNQTYRMNVKEIGYRTRRGYAKKLLEKIRCILALRKEIRKIKPDVIISTSSADCADLYFATLLTPLRYVTHIHGTIFWFPNELLKYALVHRKVFHEIRESVIGHKEFIPAKPPESSLARQVVKEFAAFFRILGVRKAGRVFVLSNQMKWEVGKLYNKEATVLKGAFPEKIFRYTPSQDIRARLGLQGKRIILNVNRLDPRKRVDLLIKSFKLLLGRFDDLVLLIGGRGPEASNLEKLVSMLDLQDKVRFLGYIEEGELLDYVSCCDIFVHPNWADFAIAAYEALALQKKVVWSVEMEIDENLAGNRHVFAALPTVDGLAEAMENALTTVVPENNDLSAYTWERYFSALMSEITEYVAGTS